jgi:hypothetical protein
MRPSLCTAPRTNAEPWPGRGMTPKPPAKLISRVPLGLSLATPNWPTAMLLPSGSATKSVIQPRPEPGPTHAGSGAPDGVKRSSAGPGFGPSDLNEATNEPSGKTPSAKTSPTGVEADGPTLPPWPNDASSCPFGRYRAKTPRAVDPAPSPCPPTSSRPSAKGSAAVVHSLPLPT